MYKWPFNVDDTGVLLGVACCMLLGVACCVLLGLLLVLETETERDPLAAP
jgi:hypothetical protein